VVGLVERAAEAIDSKKPPTREKAANCFVRLQRFSCPIQNVAPDGPLENILGMLPGMSNVKGFSVDEKQLKRVEAIVLSMTLGERKQPDISMRGGVKE